MEIKKMKGSMGVKKEKRKENNIEKKRVKHKNSDVLYYKLFKQLIWINVLCIIHPKNFLNCLFGRLTCMH
jgi:hypothetical protein